MNRVLLPLIRRSLLLVLAFSSVSPSRADQWTTPSAEELSMTSQSEVPGAPAVYLFREELTVDKLHSSSVYVRLKILTERGKDYANVEIPYLAGNGANIQIGELVGRTVHADGTSVPFTAKPLEKLIVKSQSNRYMAKVFTLPDVQIGSIIEYRYNVRNEDNYYIPPQWYLQSDLYTRKAHYNWKPTSETLITSDGRGLTSGGLSWTPILPPGAEVKQVELPGNTLVPPQIVIDLNVHDIPPMPSEEYMPPIASFTYRVLFYYAEYRTVAEFWKNEGKLWSKKANKFIGPGAAVSAAVQQLTSPSDAPDAKLHKLYTAVQQLENTDFTREHTSSEEKAQGLRDVRNSDDILTRKRGSGDQLAELFVALARAAGFKADLMAVTNRDKHIFFPNYLSSSQLDDAIAVVNLDGKDVFLDPGTRFCPYRQLAWKHSMAGGIRQAEGGAIIATTPLETYTASRLQRVANLKMDQHGSVAGTVQMIYSGNPAIHWRQRLLAGDEESLRRELQENMEAQLPNGMEIKVASIAKLQEYDDPLTVVFDVKGEPGSSTGKRLLVPGDLFESNTKPMFPNEKRDLGVYFNYAQTIQDAIRISFPDSLTVESLPTPDKLQLPNHIAYSLRSESTPTSFTIRRDYVLAEIIYTQQEYPDIRKFYAGIEAKDQQSVVLKAQSAIPDKQAAVTP